MEQRKPIDYLCYCGLYCKMCSLIAIMPNEDRALLNTMKEDGWEVFGRYEYKGFETFWAILSKLSKTDTTSLLCRGGCGDPGCQIRKCARQKKLDVCAFCEEYPCSRLQELSNAYPFVLQNNDRIKEIGLEKWLVEQEHLVAKGINHRTLCAEANE